MQGFLIWGTFTVLVAMFCVLRPHPARILVGLFFGAMGLGIHGALIATNPQSYVDFAADAPWAIYRDIGLWLTEPNPLAFGIFMLTFETVTAALILSRGRAVTWGLLGAIVFLIGITPLGLEELPNVVLAAGVAFLLTQHLPIDAWTVLRRHRHPKFTTAERYPRCSEVTPAPPHPRAEALGRATDVDPDHAESQQPPPSPAMEPR